MLPTQPRPPTARSHIFDLRIPTSQSPSTSTEATFKPSTSSLVISAVSHLARSAVAGWDDALLCIGLSASVAPVPVLRWSEGPETVSDMPLTAALRPQRVPQRAKRRASRVGSDRRVARARSSGRFERSSRRGQGLGPPLGDQRRHARDPSWPSVPWQPPQAVSSASEQSLAGASDARAGRGGSRPLDSPGTASVASRTCPSPWSRSHSPARPWIGA